MGFLHIVQPVHLNSFPRKDLIKKKCSNLQTFELNGIVWWIVCVFGSLITLWWTWWTLVCTHMNMCLKKLTPQYLFPLKTWGGRALGFPAFCLISSFKSGLWVMSLAKYLMCFESRNRKIASCCCFTWGWIRFKLFSIIFKVHILLSFDLFIHASYTISFEILILFTLLCLFWN